MVLEAAVDYSWKDEMLQIFLECHFTPTIAVHQISAAVKGCMGADEPELKECMTQSQLV